MIRQGNNFDVSSNVDVTDPAAVNAEVGRIFSALYPGCTTAAIDRAFGDLDSLYRGQFPGYHACDTPYHDLQHVLDVTLAMARLMDGHERKENAAERLGMPLFRLGIVTALFHDAGYVRRLDDTERRNGAELTLTHVSRGEHFLRSYLPMIGMEEMAGAANLIHFTGYEIPVEKIPVASRHQWRLGCLLGSADIIAQMADRCYLEKCRDRLYPEFLAGGIARKRLPDGREDVVFESGHDLVTKTPRFFEGAVHRLDKVLGGNHHYTNYHFGGRALYLEEIRRNVRFAETIRRDRDTKALKRVPPDTLQENVAPPRPRLQPNIPIDPSGTRTVPLPCFNSNAVPLTTSNCADAQVENALIEPADEPKPQGRAEQHERIPAATRVRAVSS